MRATGCLLIFACTALFHAQEVQDGGSRGTILALERVWSEAEARGDSRVLDGIFDNALVYMEEGRIVTKGECLSRMRTAGSRLRQIQPGATSVKIFGNTAIVVGTYRDKTVISGKSLQKQRRFIDTWVNKKGEWVLVATGSAPLAR